MIHPKVYEANLKQRIDNQQFCQSTPDPHFVDPGSGGGKVIDVDLSQIDNQQFCQSTPDPDN